jgi:hypothetical protein
MMSSLAVLMLANRLSETACLKMAACVLTLWTLGLHLFWFLLIPPKDTGQTVAPQQKTPSEEHAVSEGWEQKVKTGNDDKRLPTTIITGFLVSVALL